MLKTEFSYTNKKKNLEKKRETERRRREARKKSENSRRNIIRQQAVIIIFATHFKTKQLIPVILLIFLLFPTFKNFKNINQQKAMFFSQTFFYNFCGRSEQINMKFIICFKFLLLSYHLFNNCF